MARTEVGLLASCCFRSRRAHGERLTERGARYRKCAAGGRLQPCQPAPVPPPAQQPTADVAVKLADGAVCAVVDPEVVAVQHRLGAARHPGQRRGGAQRTGHHRVPSLGYHHAAGEAAHCRRGRGDRGRRVSAGRQTREAAAATARTLWPRGRRRTCSRRGGGGPDAAAQQRGQGPAPPPASPRSSRAPIAKPAMQSSMDACTPMGPSLPDRPLKPYSWPSLTNTCAWHRVGSSDF